MARRLPWLAPWLRRDVLLTWTVLLCLYCVGLGLQLLQIRLWLPNQSDRPCHQTSFLTSTHAIFPSMGKDGMICREVSLSDGKLNEKSLAGSRGEKLLDYTELADGSILEVTSTYEHQGATYVTLTRTLPNGRTQSRQVELLAKRQYMGIMNDRYAVFGFDSYLIIDCQDLSNVAKEKSPHRWIKTTTNESQSVMAAEIVTGMASIVSVSKTEAAKFTATIQRWNAESKEFEMVSSWEVGGLVGYIATTRLHLDDMSLVWSVTNDHSTLEAREGSLGEIVRTIDFPVDVHNKSVWTDWYINDRGLTLFCVNAKAGYWSSAFAIDPKPSNKVGSLNIRSSGPRFGYGNKGFVLTPIPFALNIADERTDKETSRYPLNREGPFPVCQWDGGPKAHILGDYNNPLVLEVDTSTGKIIQAHDWIRDVRTRLVYLAGFLIMICSLMLMHTFWYQLPELPAITLSLAAIVIPNMSWRSQVIRLDVTDLCDQIMLVAYTTYALNVIFGRGKLGKRILGPAILTAAFVVGCRWLVPERFHDWDIRVSNYVQSGLGMIGMMAILWIYLIRKPETNVTEHKNRPRLSILDFLLLMTAIAFLFSAVRGLGAFGFRWDRVGANLLHIASLAFLLALPMVALLSDKRLWIKLLVALFCIAIGLILLATFHRIRGDTLYFISPGGRLARMSPTNAVLETGLNMSVAVLGVCLVSVYLYACGWRLINRTSKT